MTFTLPSLTLSTRYNITANCVIPIAASQMTANLLPPEYLKMLDPDHITGIVSYLAHESSSNVNGEAFEVGGGWYSKIRWERSAGVRYRILLKYKD
jgi:NAD(P)-dependent dehydrogenase (short-subunit alcohol dehydrogenase family)